MINIRVYGLSEEVINHLEDPEVEIKYTPFSINPVVVYPRYETDKIAIRKSNLIESPVVLYVKGSAFKINLSHDAWRKVEEIYSKKYLRDKNYELAKNDWGY